MLDGEGALTVSGTGEMRDFSYNSIPWGNTIKNVIICDGVTFIGDYAFSDCTGLTSITIPDSVTSIDTWAFDSCDGISDVYYSGSKSEWEAIDIYDYNECLTNTAIHFNSTGPDDSGNSLFQVRMARSTITAVTTTYTA